MASQNLPDMKRVKIRYGPYTIPSNTHKGLEYALEGEKGILTWAAFKMKKPCEECMITTMEAGLEYPDGREATIDTGAWMHHLMLMNGGKGLADPTCPNPMMPPGERVFASGNERSVIWMTPKTGEFKSGYHIRADSTFSMELELMNLDADPKPVYLTLTYEFAPGPPPAGWLNTRPVYLDVTGCFRGSEIAPPKGKDQFTLTSTDFKAPWSGKLVSVMGHLHDGGASLQLYQRAQAANGASRQLCDSQATYGGTPQYIERSQAGKAGMKHISNMTDCFNMGEVTKGDKFYVEAHYDMIQNMPMRNAKGKLSTVMGIALWYVAVPFGN
jgi:hypothetical protein